MPNVFQAAYPYQPASKKGPVSEAAALYTPYCKSKKVNDDDWWNLDFSKFQLYNNSLLLYNNWIIYEQLTKESSCIYRAEVEKAFHC